MVANVQKSGLLAKISQRAKQANAEVAKTPINYGNPTLPPGINNGIAQLDRAWLGEYKEGDLKGQVFFMAMGSTRLPTHHDGVSVLGMKTTIGPIPLCDTPNASTKKDFKSHYNDMLDEICKLGDIKKEDLVAELEKDMGYLEKVLGTLSRLRPCFRFRTWAGKKQTTGPYAGREPRTVHEWNGRTELKEDDNADDGVNDEGSTQGSNGEATNQLEDHSTNGQQQSGDGLDTPPENVDFENKQVDEPQEENLTEEQKLEKNLAIADDTENDSQEALDIRKNIQDMALKNGVTTQEFGDALSYREVVKLMNQKIQDKIKKEVESKAAKETKSETTKKEKTPPKVGDMCKFQKNKTAKVADCKITHVNMTAGLVNLQDMATEQSYKGVKIENIKLD